MARRVVGAARGARRRQRVEWGFSKNTVTNTLGTNDVNLQRASVNFQEQVEQMTSPTLVRCRGELLIRVNMGVSGNGGLVAAGVAVVSTRAAGAGSASVPRPVDEAEFSWLWHKFFFMMVNGSEEGNLRTVRQEIDSRAMRKILSKEEEVVFVIQSDALVGTIAYEFAVNIRFLLKES